MQKHRRLSIFIISLLTFIGIVIFLLIFHIFNFLKIKEAKLAIVDIKEIPIVNGVRDIVFDGQNKLDFYSHLYFDDGDSETIEIKVDGKYDLTVNGLYNLSYIITDMKGNKSEIPFKLFVNIEKGNPGHKVSYESITPKGYELKVVDGVSMIDNHLIINKSYSIPNDYIPDNLVTITSRCEVINYVKDAFAKLTTDASVIGLNIYPSTCYRSYSFQNILYNSYVNRDGQEQAEKYSARPGYSEHQSGLAIDVNSVNDAFNYTPESVWLNDNCYKYGFIIRYPKEKEDITGYQYEPWHIRYVGIELATILYNEGNWLTIEEYYGLKSRYTK